MWLESGCTKVISHFTLFRGSKIFAFLLDSECYKSWKSTHLKKFFWQESFVFEPNCLFKVDEFGFFLTWKSEGKVWHKNYTLFFLLSCLHHFICQQIYEVPLEGMDLTRIHSFKIFENMFSCARHWGTVVIRTLSYPS